MPPYRIIGAKLLLDEKTPSNKWGHNYVPQIKIERLTPSPVDIDVAWLLYREKMGEISGTFPELLEVRSSGALIRVTLKFQEF